ncbi:MAG: hypothetical protein QXU97_00215 [Fervidicoccaceae archaeon]
MASPRMLTTRSLLKTSLRVEVLFNGALLMLVSVGAPVPEPTGLYAVMAVLLASAEVVVAASIAALCYRTVMKVEMVPLAAREWPRQLSSPPSP